MCVPVVPPFVSVVTVVTVPSSDVNVVCEVVLSGSDALTKKLEAFFCGKPR